MPSDLPAPEGPPLREVARARVIFADTDQMGMVYYANYFVWMEIGRTDFCRECGFSYADLEREEQAFLPVAEADCRYRAPACVGVDAGRRCASGSFGQADYFISHQNR